MKIPSFLQLLFASALIALVGSCATTSRSGPAALAGTWTNSLGTVWTMKADGTFDVDRNQRHLQGSQKKRAARLASKIVTSH